MGVWRRVELTDEEREIVQRERYFHPHPFTQRKLQALWLLHLKQPQRWACEVAGVSRKTLDRWLTAYCEGGLTKLKEWDAGGSESELAEHRESLEKLFRERPPRSIAEAAQRIFDATGLKRGETQVRAFLKSLGMSWRRTAAIPVPPKKT